MVVVLFMHLASAQEEVEVTGVKVEPAPGVVTIQIDETIPSTDDLASLAMRSPGVVVRRLGSIGDYATLAIRGSSARQVEVVLDGISLNPDGMAAANLSELPIAAISRIDIFRADAPISLGGSGLGGVLHLTPRTDGSFTDAAVTLASHDTWRGTLAVGAGTDQINGFVALDGLSTAGDYPFYDDGGTPFTEDDDQIRDRVNNHKRQANLLSRLSWEAGNSRVTVLDAGMLRSVGIPGPSFLETSSTRLAIDRNLLAAASETSIGASTFVTRLSRVDRHERLDDRNANTGLIPTLRDTRQNSTTGQFTVTSAPSSAVDLSAVAQLRREQHAGDELLRRAPLISHQRLSARGAVRGRLHLDDTLQAHLGAHVVAMGSPHAPADWFGVPRAGLEVRASDAVEFHATGGGAFRAPDFTELYGNQGGIIGNPGLRPEQGVFAELGASLRSEALTFQVDTHWTRRRDLIVYVLNAQRVAIAQNLGVTRVQGVEAAVVTAPTVWMDLQANVTWSNSSNRDPDPAYFGNKVPGLPAFELHLRPSLHHRELLRTGYSMDWSTPTFWDATNWHRSTHRLFHGAWLRYQPVLAFPSLEISALNITNRRSEEVPRDPLFINGDTVRQPVTDLLGYPLPGRTLWLTLRWQR